MICRICKEDYYYRTQSMLGGLSWKESGYCSEKCMKKSPILKDMESNAFQILECLHESEMMLLRDFVDEYDSDYSKYLSDYIQDVIERRLGGEERH